MALTRVNGLIAVAVLSFVLGACDAESEPDGMSSSDSTTTPGADAGPSSTLELGGLELGSGPPLSADCTVDDYEQEVIRNECRYVIELASLVHDGFVVGYYAERVVGHPFLEAVGAFESGDYDTVEGFVSETNAMYENSWNDGTIADSWMLDSLDQAQRDQVSEVLTLDDYAVLRRGDELVFLTASVVCNECLNDDISFVQSGDQTTYRWTRPDWNVESHGRIVLVMPGEIVESTGEIDGNVATWEIVRQGEVEIYAVSRP